MDLAATLGANARRFRLAINLSQAEVADAVGVSQQTIFGYESGQSFPRADTFAALAKVLKVRPWQLVAEENEGGTIPPELVEHVAAAARACGLKVNNR